MDLRPAGPADAAAIAPLHADSRRRHYRGAYADSYLDGDVVAERLAVWGFHRALGGTRGRERRWRARPAAGQAAQTALRLGRRAA